MLSIHFDIRTMASITVLFSLGFGAGLLAFSLAHGTFRGLKAVGAGMLSVGLAFLLIGLRGRVPAALSVVLANTLLLAGFALFNNGIQRFRGLAPRDAALSAAAVAANAGLFILYTYAAPSVAMRVLWISLFLALFSALCLRSLLKRGEMGDRAPRLLVSLGFAIFGGFMLLRAWWVLDETAMQSFMAAGTIHGLAFLVMILLLLFLTFGLVWMANVLLQRELRRYEGIISATPDAITLIDRDGNYRLANDAALQMLGKSREELVGKSSRELFGPEFYDTVTRPNLDKVFQGHVGRESLWIDLPGGQRRYVALTYHPVSGSRGLNAYAAINAKDMTELYLAQVEKQRIFRLSLDMLCVAGFDGYFKEVNPAWTRTLGWSEKELLVSQWLDFVHPDDVQMTMDAAGQLAEGTPIVDFVNRYRTRVGTYRHISWMSHPDNEARLIYAVARDVTERIRMEDELKDLASTDALTGAANRRSFMHRLGEEIDRSIRYETPLTLLILDIDHFKRINDAHGHAAGDEVLRRCVDTCMKTLRSTDVFGRLGGEEFSVVLPHTNLDTGMDTAERLRGILARDSVTVDDGAVSFTVSMGVAELKSGETAEDLLKRADDALYRAKRRGRDRVEEG